jgi:transcriptional regulator with XRE-family HTH domain
MAHGRQLLADWLERSHTRQRVLARKLGKSDAYISQVLSGLRRPKLETLTDIEALTGVPVRSWLATRRGISDQTKSA